METKYPPLSFAVKMGLLTGLVYCIFIFCQNQFFYANPIEFSVIKLICYLFILSGFFITGYLQKKQQGGFITFKECLRSLLVAVIITELIYLLFNTIYVKYIEPGFFDKLKAAWLAYYIEHKLPQDVINNSMQNFKDAGKITFSGLASSYGFSVTIDAIFVIIISAILKKNKPDFVQPTQS